MLRIAMNILGILGFIIGFISWIDSDQQRRIYYDYKTDIVWQQTRVFPLKLVTSDNSELQRNIHVSKTLVTIWNGSKNTVKQDDVRVPLKIAFDEGELFDYQILTKLSVVSDNFEIVKINPNELFLKWKVFDPGMAIQIAFLHQGKTPSMSLTSTIGPQTSVSRRDGFGRSANIGILCGLVIGFYLAFKILTWSLVKITSTEGGFIRRPAWMGIGGIYVVVMVSAAIWLFVIFSGTYVGIMFGDSQSPIPLELDY